MFGKTAEAFAEGQPFKASTLKWRAEGQRRAAEGGGRYSKPHEGKGAIRLARVVRRSGGSTSGQAGGVVLEVSGAGIDDRASAMSSLRTHAVTAARKAGSRKW